jgi:hypothetical protein
MHLIFGRHLKHTFLQWLNGKSIFVENSWELIWEFCFSCQSAPLCKQWCEKTMLWHCFACWWLRRAPGHAVGIPSMSLSLLVKSLWHGVSKLVHSSTVGSNNKGIGVQMYFVKKKSQHTRCLTECILLKNLSLVIYVSTPQLQRHFPVYIQVCKATDSACDAAQGVVPRCAVGPTQSLNA